MTIELVEKGLSERAKTVEWKRLAELSNRSQPEVRRAFRAAIKSGHFSPVQFQETVARIVNRSAREAASKYGMIHNPKDPAVLKLIHDLSKNLSDALSLASPETARKAKALLPRGTTAIERTKVLESVSGLDSRSAQALVRHRQKMQRQGLTIKQVEAETKRYRAKLLIARTDRVAATETDRFINESLKAVWGQNNEATAGAKKMILTRRDGRVCPYCIPLDGLQASITGTFATVYGPLDAPPFHSHCRCMLVMST